MAHTSIDTTLNSLVLNKIPSMENFKYMQENNLINENELYFIKESNPILIMETNQFVTSSSYYVHLRGPLCTFKTGSVYKVKFFLDKTLVVQGGKGIVRDIHTLDIETDNFIISISPENRESRVWVEARGNSDYDLGNNPLVQIYED